MKIRGGNILREPSQAQKAPHMFHFAARIEDGGLGGYDALEIDSTTNMIEIRKFQTPKPKHYFCFTDFGSMLPKAIKIECACRCCQQKRLTFIPF
jgi:hypothetical protein